MKKFLSIIAMFCLAISIFTFSGCAVSLSAGPKKDDAVTSNGGLVVRKGDYLYFANGYVSNSSLSGKDNNYGVARNGAIYRAKLQNGELMYDVTLDEDENEVKTLKNVELVCPMVAGFEYTNLYIFGNTIYFATPNTEKDKTGKIRFDLTDIYAVGINGGNAKKLVNALNISSKDSFNFSYIDGKVYLTYLNENELFNLKISGSKIENKTKVASSVSSYAINENGDNYVYYTRAVNDDEKSLTGNVLAKANLTTNKETILKRDNNNTYTVKKVANGKIFYTRTNTLTTNAYIYSKNLEDFETNEEKQYTVVAYSSNQYILSVEGYDAGVVVSDNNKLLYLTGTKNLETDITTLYDGDFTVLSIFGTKIYGKDSESNLLRIDVSNKKVDTILTKDVEFNFDMDSKFDYENGYAYYYVKYTGDEKTGYYLNRVYLNAQEKETELVGVVLSEHKKQNKK